MGAGSKNTSVLQLVLIFYCLGSFVVGLGLIAVGMWMNIDENVKAYLIVFSRSPDDDLLLAATACFIVAGILLCGISACALVAMFRNMPSLLIIFMVVAFLILTMEITLGFLVVEFNHDIHRQVKDGMRETIRYHYMWDNTVGKAWNRVQLRKKCCGADGSWDYYMSDWWISENSGVTDPNEASSNVPDTCCVLEANQDRDPGRVDPQDPTPKDRRRCNEDAAGRKDGSGFLHGRGCFARMLDFIDEYYWAIMGVSLGVGVAMAVGMVICWLVYVEMQDNDETMVQQRRK